MHCDVLDETGLYSTWTYTIQADLRVMIVRDTELSPVCVRACLDNGADYSARQACFRRSESVLEGG